MSMFKKLSPLEKANRNREKIIEKEVKEILRACKSCAKKMIKDGETKNGIPYYYATVKEAELRAIEIINNSNLYYKARRGIYCISGNSYIAIDIIK